jgi:hypothetical protein
VDAAVHACFGMLRHAVLCCAGFEAFRGVQEEAVKAAIEGVLPRTS